MRKILLIGDFSDTLQRMNESLSKEYNVQISSLQLENVKGMFKILKPEMLIACITQKGIREGEIMEWMRKDSSNIPIMLVSTKEILSHVDEEEKHKTFMTMELPVNTEGLLRKCRVFWENGNVSLEAAKTKKILVVDDSALGLRNMRAMLADHFEVILATGGEMGIQKAIDEEPDLIILDYDMPHMDGKETFEILLHSDETRNIPVIFLSGVSDGKKIRDVLEKQPAGYVLKPPDSIKLIQLINEVLGLNK